MDQTRLLLACGIATLIAAAVLPLLIRSAGRLRLLDRPGGRKQHAGAIPLVGGLATLVGLMAAALWYDGLSHFSRTLLATTVAMVLIGALDDRHSLGVRVRVLLQAILVLVVILATGVYVHHLGRIFGHIVQLGWLGIPFTIIAMVGLLNAFNLMDGIDGLAICLGLVAVAAITLGAELPVYQETSALLLLMGAALLPALTANLGFFGQRGKCFLGDAGSTLIGYLVGWGLIALSQTPGSKLSPVGALWCVALPVLDTLAVMYRRIRRHQSPFKPGRGHIHYLLIDSGFSTTASLVILVAAAAGMWLLGALVRELGLGSGSNLIAFCVLAVSYVVSTHHWDTRIRGLRGATALPGRGSQMRNTVMEIPRQQPSRNSMPAPILVETKGPKEQDSTR